MIKKYNVYLYKNHKLDKSYNNIKGLTKDKNITLILDDIKTIINENELIRENDEFKFSINLLKKESKYLLKSHNLLYEIEVTEAYIKRKGKEVEIKYKIETSEELIKINIIEST